jgi:MFS family permease
VQAAAPASGRAGGDFGKFWVGQTVSNLGSSITLFALPLLVYELTGSAVNLALTTAAQFIPHLLFGLVIGAYVDRLDRKKLMITVDLLRLVVISTIPLMSALDSLTVEWIYATGFVMSTLTIFFDSSQFAAIPSLVAERDLVTANGRIQASFAGAQVAGPLLAGLMVSALPLSGVVLVDASTFLVSAFSLALIRNNFNQVNAESRSSVRLRTDVMEGLRYVMRQPVLRDISILVALANLIAAPIYSQIVLFADVQLNASRSQTAFLYASGAVGMMTFGLLAGRIRKRFTFSVVARWALIIESFLFVVFGLLTNVWVAMLVLALMQGQSILFNIQSSSLRQLITPNHMLGRVMTIAAVLAWSAIPLGAYLGGLAIEASGQPDLIYALLGGASLILPLFFFTFTELRRAEEHIPAATRLAEDPRLTDLQENTLAS